MRFLPRIVYNNGGAITLNFTVAQRFWSPEEGDGLAGEDTSAAGIPESFVVRYDHTVEAVLRFTDDERTAFLSFIEWAIKNKGTAFTFRFAAADAATEYSMYLVEPKAGDKVRPTRDQQSPWVWELPITMRNVAGTRIHVPLPLT